MEIKPDPSEWGRPNRGQSVGLGSLAVGEEWAEDYRIIELKDWKDL